MLLVDQSYRYQEFGMGYGPWENHCRIRIFQPHPKSTVVVVSDIRLDTGTSVTNFSQSLATLIVKSFGLNPTLVIWIEHYYSCGWRRSSAEFRLVQFLWEGKTAVHFCWKPLSQQQVEGMAGCFGLVD